MDTITLSPEQMRERFGSHFHVNYNYKKRNKNEELLGKEIGRDDYIGIPFLNIEFFHFFKFYPENVYSITEVVGKIDDHSFKSDFDFSCLEDAQKYIQEELEKEILSMKEKSANHKNNKYFQFLLMLSSYGLVFGQVKKNYNQYMKFKNIVENIDAKNIGTDFFKLTDKQFPAHLPSVGENQFYVTTKDNYNNEVKIIPVSLVNIYPVSTMEKDNTIPVHLDFATTKIEDGSESVLFSVSYESFLSSNGDTYRLPKHGETLHKNKDSAIQYAENAISENLKSLKASEENLKKMKESYL